MDEKNFMYGSLHQPECIGEGDPTEPPQEKLAEANDEDNDEDVDIEELEHRVWRDRMRLKRLKEQQQHKHKELQGEASKQRQSQEQARRKKMCRAQDGILKNMLKLMEVCDAQGFVYGILLENGKPVSGASDNLRAWWKEKVSEYDVEGVDEGKSVVTVNHQSHAEGNPLDPAAAAAVKEENTMEIIRKRSVAEAEPVLNQCIYTCANVQCPHSDLRHGFLDRNARNSRWAAIASYLPQRTDNDIKNYWNTHLKKKIKKYEAAADGYTMTSGTSSICLDNMEARKQDMATLRLPRFYKAPPIYACSTENISRLLEGWMRSSPQQGKLQGSAIIDSNDNNNNNNNNSSSSSNSNAIVVEHKVQAEGDRGRFEAMTHEDLDSLLTFGNMSGIAYAEATKQGMGDDQPPLSFLEKWLFDETSAQVDGLMDLPADCCSNSMF
ncbi:hypothetical protein GW17_00021965 [Ensete ventricosum]|nr:hypothetical protein GW17_00021965 [Ensete ventricosum]